MRPISLACASLTLALLAGCAQAPRASAPPSGQDALTSSSPTATPSSDDHPTSTPPSMPSPSTQPDQTHRPKAPATPVDTAGAQPTTVATDQPPSVPAAATSATSEGAAVFVEFYVEIYNFAYTTGRPSLLLPHHDDGCRACSALVGLITEPREETRYLTLTDVAATVAGSSARVQTELVQAETDSAAQQRATTLFDVEWLDGRWQVIAITLAPD